MQCVCLCVCALVQAVAVAAAMAVQIRSFTGLQVSYLKQVQIVRVRMEMILGRDSAELLLEHLLHVQWMTDHRRLLFKYIHLFSVGF